MSAITAHGAPLTAHALGLRFGDPASIGIARRAAAVAGMVDHIEAEHGFPVALPCVVCAGSGDCGECNGDGTCQECNGDDANCIACDGSYKCVHCQGESVCQSCNGDRVNRRLLIYRSDLIDKLHAAPVDRLLDIARHFEYTPSPPQDPGSPFIAAHRSPLTAPEAAS